MAFLLVVATISLCAGLAGLRLSLRTRQESVRLRALNNALESRVAERTAELRRALDQASARALDLAAWLAKPMDIGRMGQVLADTVAAARAASAA